MYVILRDLSRYWTFVSSRYWTFVLSQYWTMSRCWTFVSSRYWTFVSSRYWTFVSSWYWTFFSSRYWNFVSHRIDNLNYWNMRSWSVLGFRMIMRWSRKHMAENTNYLKVTGGLVCEEALAERRMRELCGRLENIFNSLLPTAKKACRSKEPELNKSV